jgi:Cation transporter/ATPase, N-terminus
MSRRPEDLAPPDRPLISPFIAGDPIRLGADVTSAAQLTTALGLGVSSTVVDLVPGVALVVVPTPRDERLSLRWVQLPHQPLVWPDGLPSVALVLLAPPPLNAEVVHLAARLRSCLSDAALVAETRRATTRPGLVDILASAERDGSEAALTDAEIFTLLDSGPGGLPAGEAARRLASDGPNRLERVARRSLVRRLLAQFTNCSRCSCGLAAPWRSWGASPSWAGPCSW